MKLVSKTYKPITEKSKKLFSQKNLVYRLTFGFLGFCILFFFWFIIALIMTSIEGFEQFKGFMPLPAIKSFFSMTKQSFFWISVLASLGRISIGLLTAAAIGIPFGLLIGFYKKLRDLSHVPIQFIRMISPISWMPIAIILLPGFNEAIYFLIIITTIWPIILNTSQGVMNVNPQWVRMAENQGATDMQLLFHVIFPGTVPYIIAGLRMAIGVAWIVLIPAELLGISSGLGYLINDARDTMEYSSLMAIVIVIGILGFCIDFLFQLLQNKVDWRKK